MGNKKKKRKRKKLGKSRDKTGPTPIQEKRKFPYYARGEKRKEYNSGVRSDSLMDSMFNMGCFL